MSDSKAALEVFKLWGNAGFIANKPRIRTDSNWTRQIGFLSPGCEDGVTVVGEGFNTWDAAFAALPADKGIQGSYSGMTAMRVLVNTQNMTAPASLQVMIDGQKYGPPVIITSQTPVNIMLDTRPMVEGYHVVCGLLSYVDATAAKVLRTNQRASMFIVKQIQVTGNTGPGPQLIQPSQPTPPLPTDVVHLWDEWPPKP